MSQPDRDELCGNCGHAYKFHRDLEGEGRACDAEVPADEVETLHEPHLCGCAQFVWIRDPEEV